MERAGNHPDGARSRRRNLFVRARGAAQGGSGALRSWPALRIEREHAVDDRTELGRQVGSP
jgi:hypothetical protein